MRIATAILTMIGGALAAIGILQVSGLALLGALAASVATASDRPRRLASWIPPAIIVVAIATVSLADLVGVGTHHVGA